MTVAGRMRTVWSWASSVTDVAKSGASTAVSRMARIIILYLGRMLKTAVVFVLVAGAALSGAQNVERRTSNDEPRVRPNVDWPVYGGDQAGTKFSPLADINTTNVSRLAVAWEWTTGEKALEQFGTRPGNFQNTPLMIDNVLYLSTPYNRVVALNAQTGAQVWA